jgi:hypothetical protein
MPPFQVRLSCRDCTGEDEQGCFEGGTELLNDGEQFDTRELAAAAGIAAIRGVGPWHFEVEDVEEC